MIAPCAYCGSTFRSAALRDAHERYCEVVDRHRGKTYTLIAFTKKELIHISNNATFRPYRRSNSDENIEVFGVFWIYSTGVCSSDSIRNFLKFDRLISGEVNPWTARESTPEDIEEFKNRALERIDRELEVRA